MFIPDPTFSIPEPGIERHPILDPQQRIYGNSVADPDPGSGVFLTPGSGMGKKSGPGSGMNNPGHISESYNQFFGLEYSKFFGAEPG
jgi:hypothetical protein